LITRLCVFVWVGSSRFNLQQRKNNIWNVGPCGFDLPIKGKGGPRWV
jgi:hypothetical protein